jgi:3-vinyl bacteriochlorophyllide hydratase
MRMFRSAKIQSVSTRLKSASAATDRSGPWFKAFSPQSSSWSSRFSVGLIAHWWLTGSWLMAAHASVVIKTMTLYAIMITGSIWEKEVFGAYLFARPFFWEDMVSMLVLALHTAYLAALFGGLLPDGQLMALAAAAYLSYVINAGQFLWKFRLARLDASSHSNIEASA